MARIKVWFSDVGEEWDYSRSWFGKKVKALKDVYIFAKTSEDHYVAIKREHGRKVIHITDHSDGTKMEGFRSISTSCRLNKRCIDRSKVPGSICEKCYAQHLMSYRKGLNKWLEWNFKVLTAGILRREDLPEIDDKCFRIEAFGDAANVYHATNYLNIIRKNKGTVFSVWTKNPDFYDEDIRKNGKPRNVVFVLSSPNVNDELNLDKIKEKYPWIDIIFTVFDDGTPSNCAGIHCKTCGNTCYGKKAKGGYRREKLR